MELQPENYKELISKFNQLDKKIDSVIVALSGDTKLGSKGLVDRIQALENSVNSIESRLLDIYENIHELEKKNKNTETKVILFENKIVNYIAAIGITLLALKGLIELIQSYVALKNG
jgi:uncharacterized phage infection (PIP) family protein YhgE